MAHNAPQHNGDHNLPFHNAGVHNGGASSSAVEDPESTSEIEVLWDTGEVILWDDGDWMAWEDAVSIPDDFTISVPGGSYAADSLDATNATNGAGGISAGKMAATSAAQWTVLSVNSSRDQEISTSGNRFRLYLRYDGDKALFMRVDKTGVDGSTGILQIGVCTGLGTSAELATTYYSLFSTSTANADITGFTGGTEYLFGCSGLDIYVKIDGSERVRIQDFHHVQSGKAGVKPGSGYYVGAVTVNFNSEAALYSTPSSDIFDVRDLTDWTTTTTTGSISASSTSLSVASAGHLRVGMYVVVEIGNEAGAGARGTTGVGGTWPALLYADAATRAADTSQANNTYAGQVDTGNVYRWATGSPGSWTLQTSYYMAKIIPRSLRARITGISGTTITLDTAATVTATNANVYVDVEPVINSLFMVNSVDGGYINTVRPNPMTVYFGHSTPAYIVDGVYDPNTTLTHIKGAGKTVSQFYTPKGVASGMVVTKGQGNSTSDRLYVRDFHVKGNSRFTGYGLAWKQSMSCTGWEISSGNIRRKHVSQTVVNNTTETNVAYPYGIMAYQTSYVEIVDTKATDTWQSGNGINLCTDCYVTRPEVILTDGLGVYIQWMVHDADSTRTTIDCGDYPTDARAPQYNVTSPILTGGFESFRGTGAVWTKPRGYNAVFSMNTEDAWSISDYALTVAANSRVSAGGLFSVAGSGVPALGINTNIGGSVSNGGTITRPVITQEGVIDTSNNLLTLISVAASCPAISIAYPNLTSVDFVSGGTTNFGHIVSQGAGTVVTNGQTSGKSVYNVTGSGNRNIHLTGGSGSSVDAYTQAHVGDYYVNP